MRARNDTHMRANTTCTHTHTLTQQPHNQDTLTHNPQTHSPNSHTTHKHTLSLMHTKKRIDTRNASCAQKRYTHVHPRTPTQEELLDALEDPDEEAFKSLMDHIQELRMVDKVEERHKAEHDRVGEFLFFFRLCATSHSCLFSHTLCPLLGLGGSGQPAQSAPTRSEGGPGWRVPSPAPWPCRKRRAGAAPRGATAGAAPWWSFMWCDCARTRAALPLPLPTCKRLLHRRPLIFPVRLHLISLPFFLCFYIHACMARLVSPLLGTTECPHHTM